MVDVVAELKRRNSTGDPVDWTLVEDSENPDTGLSDPVIDYVVRTKLIEIYNRLLEVLTHEEDEVSPSLLVGGLSTPPGGLPIPPGTTSTAWVEVPPWTQALKFSGTNDGAIEGHVVFSPDGGVTVHAPIDSGELAAGEFTFSVPVFAPWVRVDVDNLEVVDVTFDVVTTYAAKPTSSFAFRADGNIDPSWPALLVKNIPTGQQPDGDFVNQRADGTVFVDHTPLGAAGVFESAIVDTDGWASGELFIATDQVSGALGVEIEFIEDVQAAIPVVRGTRTYSFTADDVTAGFAVYRFPTELDGLLVRYTNGGTPQGDFFSSLALRTGVATPQSSLESLFTPTNVAVMTRGLLNAKNDLGTYGNILRGALGGLRLSVFEQEAELQSKACSDASPSSLTASVTAAQLDVSKLADRKYVTISNADGTRTIYYGNSAALTSSNGTVLPPESAHQQEWDENVDIWVVTGAGTASARLSQTAGTV